MYRVQLEKAWMPVIALPRISVCMSYVPWERPIRQHDYTWTVQDSRLPSYVLVTWRLATCLPMWYSSAHALPPRTSRTFRECSRATPQLLRFTIETISGALFPSSFKRPTWRLASKPNAAAECASTSFFCTSWKDASGLLNCFRSSAYSRARFIQSSRAPTTPQEIPYLALLRHAKGEPKPRDFGKRAECDTRTSSRKIEPVTDTRRASLFLICGAERPLVPFSTRNPRTFPSHLQRAQMTKRSL